MVLRKEEAVVIQDENALVIKSLDCGCWSEHDPCNIYT